MQNLQLLASFPVAALVGFLGTPEPLGLYRSPGRLFPVLPEPFRRASRFIFTFTLFLLEPLHAAPGFRFPLFRLLALPFHGVAPRILTPPLGLLAFLVLTLTLGGVPACFGLALLLGLLALPIQSVAARFLALALGLLAFLVLALALGGVAARFRLALALGLLAFLVLALTLGGVPARFRLTLLLAFLVLALAVGGFPARFRFTLLIGDLTIQSVAPRFGFTLAVLHFLVLSPDRQSRVHAQG